MVNRSSAIRVGSCQCPAMLTSTLPFRWLRVMDRPMSSASAMSRAARSGSVAASAPAMLTSALPLNALPFQGSSVMDWAL